LASKATLSKPAAPEEKPAVSAGFSLNAGHLALD
jgi:hypothetical protein